MIVELSDILHFQMGVAMFLLWQFLGPSVLAGLAVLLLMVPGNGIIYGKQQQLNVSFSNWS